MKIFDYKNQMPVAWVAWTVITLSDVYLARVDVKTLPVDV